MVRLVPGAYLEYKSALLNECNKQGGLRLAQARALIKIDVNKTRKIYDFLIREGYITKAWGSKGLGYEITSLESDGPKDSMGILKSFFFELNSHCKKRRTKETLCCVNVCFILHPALKHSCCWYCATELCAR